MSASAGTRQTIGQILVEKELISLGQLETALDYERAHGGLLGEILAAQGLIDRLAIASVLARQWSVVQFEGTGSPERGQAGHAATPAREDVAALHLRIAGLESVVTQLNAELARRKEQLELLAEIVSGQPGPAVSGPDPADATQSNAADLRPFEVIPQFGSMGSRRASATCSSARGASARRSSLEP